MRDISIIDALPIYDCPKRILTIGAGHGRLEWHLFQKGYDVTATDIEMAVKWKNQKNLKFFKHDILKYEEISAPIIICSQVLEHITDFKTAYKNLIKYAKIRLIVTFPYKYSFHSPDHINFWDDASVKIFETLAKPYSISISKIRTKPEDKNDKYVYLLIIDKRQKYA